MFRSMLSAVAAALVAGSLAVVGVAPAAADVAAQPAQRGGYDQAQWRVRTPMPEARGEVGVASLGGRVYVVGGTVQRGDEPPVNTSTLVTSYDPRADRWSRHAPLPQALTHVSVAPMRGKLYAVGGFADVVHLEPQRVAFVYDPRRDRWSRLPDMPEALGSVGVATVGGELHVLGGRDSSEILPVPGTPLSAGYGTVRSHYVYDATRRTWSEAEPLPVEPRDHVGVAVVGRDIHVFGGRVADTVDNLTRHDVYDTRTGRWSAAAPLPTARSAGAAVVLDGRIVYAGGECETDPDVDPTGTYDDVTAYDPRTDRWSTLASMPLGGRHGFGAGEVGGRAYFLAGAQFCRGGATTDTLELDLVR